jgi:glyoxylase-like metal-dependent hydrolase (beta-lactamase superfamily II)
LLENQILRYSLEIVKQGLDLDNLLKDEVVKSLNPEIKLSVTPFPNVEPLYHGTKFELDKNITLIAIETPGHTLGSMCFYTNSFEGALFTGDTYYGVSTPRSDSKKQLDTILKIIDKDFKYNLKYIFSSTGGEVMRNLNIKRSQIRISTCEKCNQLMCNGSC